MNIYIYIIQEYYINVIFHKSIALKYDGLTQINDIFNSENVFNRTLIYYVHPRIYECAYIYTHRDHKTQPGI